jgi:hypothetical protein
MSRSKATSLQCKQAIEEYLKRTTTLNSETMTEPYRVRLLDYQLHSIQARIDASYAQIETSLLDKYKVFSLEELLATDYEEIIEDIAEWHWQIHSRYTY